eukprot:scaffold123034_cov14-Tisochrysis_lutea.AAC.1
MPAACSSLNCTSELWGDWMPLSAMQWQHRRLTMSKVVNLKNKKRQHQPKKSTFGQGAGQLANRGIILLIVGYVCSCQGAFVLPKHPYIFAVAT